MIIEQFYFIEKMLADLEAEPEIVITKLKTLKKLLFNANNLHIHLVGSTDELNELKLNLKQLSDVLSNDQINYLDFDFNPIAKNEALYIASKVQYVGQIINLYDNGFAYKGQLQVLAKLLSREYLY